MPVVVVAILPVKSDSVEAAREILTGVIPEVHAEPGCQLYSLHQAGDTFVFVEQWADQDAIDTHMKAPSLQSILGGLAEHLSGAPDIKMLERVPAGDPTKGTLRP